MIENGERVLKRVDFGQISYILSTSEKNNCLVKYMNLRVFMNVRKGIDIEFLGTLTNN